MEGGRFDAASQEASDEDSEDDDEEEDLETMTVTESGDVGEGALEQVAPAPFDSLSSKSCFTDSANLSRRHEFLLIGCFCVLNAAIVLRKLP